ncbi:MAG: DUF4349 domain-containing protein, partial [Nocardioidaceae bacterium]
FSACSSGSDQGRSSAGASGAADVAAVAAAPTSGREIAATSPPTQVRITAVVKTGRILLVSAKVAQVQSEVRNLLAEAGGTVDSARSSNDEDGRVQQSRLVLRVPVERFEEVRTAIERLGRLESSTESQRDVTTQVIDVAERVETLRNSLDRLQRFQRTATDVRDLLRVESQITQRQSELRSLEAQQAYLADQSSMSTLTVEVSAPDTQVASGPLDDAGFLTGLRGGWHALVAIALVTLTVLGAAVPLSLVALAVGVPIALALRRLLRRRRPAAVEPVSPAGQ